MQQKNSISQSPLFLFTVSYILFKRSRFFTKFGDVSVFNLYQSSVFDNLLNRSSLSGSPFIASVENKFVMTSHTSYKYL